MQNSVFSITKCPRKFEAQKIFEVSRCDPKSVSDLEKSNSGQETLEQPINDFKAELQFLGKRKKCEETKRPHQSLFQAKTNSKKAKGDKTSKGFKVKTSSKSIKTLASSFENTFYGHACNILKSRVQYEINNELRKFEEKGFQRVNIERLETIVKGGIEGDVMRGYLEMQSEVIKNVSFNNFRKLMSGKVCCSNS